MIATKHTSMARAATWVSILLAATFVAPMAGAQGRGGSVENDLALVETEVVGLEKRFAALRGEVSGGSLTRSPRLIAERYNEARYAYLVEDYERCALLFYSLIENEDLKGDARQPEAEWNLAECLFLDGNLLPAQSHFKRIVDKGATHSYHGDALLKLIEIYGRTGNVSQFNKYYNTFVRSSQDNSPTSLRIRYEMGKTMFFQDKLPEAQAIFAAFPRGSTYTPQARYFSGAILIEEGRRAARREDPDLATQKFRQGLVVFQEVLQLRVVLAHTALHHPAQPLHPPGGLTTHMGRHPAGAVAEGLDRAGDLDGEGALGGVDLDAATGIHRHHLELGDDGATEKARLLGVGGAHLAGVLARPPTGDHAALPPGVVGEVGDEGEHLVGGSRNLDAVLEVDAHVASSGAAA